MLPAALPFGAHEPAHRLPSAYRLLMVDAHLNDLVLSALENSPHVPLRNLRFEASQGRVVLRGVVRSYFQKQMAQETLKALDGVDEIENQLEVCWS